MTLTPILKPRQYITASVLIPTTDYISAGLDKAAGGGVPAALDNSKIITRDLY